MAATGCGAGCPRATMRGCATEQVGPIRSILQSSPSESAPPRPIGTAERPDHVTPSGRLGHSPLVENRRRADHGRVVEATSEELPDAADRGRSRRVGDSRLALDWAVAEAQLRHASLEVVNAWQPAFIVGFGGFPGRDRARGAGVRGGAHRVLDEMTAGVHPADPSLPIEKLAVRGSGAWALLEVARGADLIVVGSRDAAASQGCSWAP